MKNVAVSLFGLGALAASFASHATLFSGSYTVDANRSEPGFVVQIENIATNPLSFNLEHGESTSFDLFRIYTNEYTVDEGEDDVRKPITVGLNFTLPSTFGGQVVGDTAGYHDYSVVFGNIQGGKVTWNSPVSFFYNPNGVEHLVVSLSNQTFNVGSGGHTFPGGWDGANVRATVKSVPEPGTLALFGGGLIVLGWIGRRRAASS